MQIRLEVLRKVLTNRQTNSDDYNRALAEVITVLGHEVKGRAAYSVCIRNALKRNCCNHRCTVTDCVSPSRLLLPLSLSLSLSLCLCVVVAAADDVDEADGNH